MIYSIYRIKVEEDSVYTSSTLILLGGVGTCFQLVVIKIRQFFTIGRLTDVNPP
jgi:hypothetical protein